MKQGLLLVDIQNDYFTDGAMALVGMEQAAENAALLLKQFREASQPLYHIRHISVRPGAGFFLPDTVGAETHALVKPLPTEPLIIKHFPNSFRETTLLEQLKRDGITHLVICGAMSHMCIDTTVRAAFDLGFSCTVAEDACATRDLEFNGEVVPAKSVHYAFMAALKSPFAKIRSTRELL